MPTTQANVTGGDGGVVMSRRNERMMEWQNRPRCLKEANLVWQVEFAATSNDTERRMERGGALQCMVQMGAQGLGI